MMKRMHIKRWVLLAVFAVGCLSWAQAGEGEPKASKADCTKECCPKADASCTTGSKMKDCPMAADAPKSCCPMMKKAEGAAAMGMAKVGEAAPDFALADPEGVSHKLSDMKGKVVVAVWTNPDCPFVKRHDEAGTVKALADHYADKDVQMVMIDSTTPEMGGSAERTKAAEAHYGDHVLQLLDPAGAAGHVYGAKTTPHVFVIDAQGKLAYQGAIDNDPRGSLPEGEKVNYAQKAVDALLAGEPVAEPSTKPYGCSVKYAKKGE